jgi:predicted ATPase
VYAISMLERGVRRTPRASTVEFLATALELDASRRGALITAARGETPSAPSLRTSPDLRLPATPLIGREGEMAQICGMLARPSVRLVTLTGAPGSGKTRLALAVAAERVTEYRDGAVVAALGSLGSHSLVMAAIRQVLGLPEAHGEPDLEALAKYFGACQILLVLDNFEHVLGAGPDVVELLARCPGLQVLATSRSALRVRAEHELPVLPLALPRTDQQSADDLQALGRVASVALFVARARAAAPSFRLTTENASAVVAICRRLDGLPLALELAAPWIKLLAPQELARRLDRRLEMLVEGPRDLPERQRTMRAALAWGCEPLDEAPRALLRRLAVFAGSAPLDGLELVCQARGALPGGIVRLLALLVDHSLVQRVVSDQEEPRVTMLETVREYCRELLAEAGETESTALAHLEYYAGLAIQFRREIRTAAQASWLERLGREHDNVRAALAWAVDCGRAEAGLRLAGAMWLFWDIAGHRQEGLAWIESLLAVGGSTDPALRAQALHAAGRLAEEVGSYDLSITRHTESLAICRQRDDLHGIAEALRGMGLAIGNQGNHGRAIELLDEAVSLLRKLDDPGLLATTLMNLGVVLAIHGDSRRSTAQYEEALALHSSVGNALGTALCLINLGERARLDGNLERAQFHLDEAVTIARRVDAPYHLAAAVANQGDLARTRGDPSGAGACYRESLHIFAEIGERLGVGVCMRRLAWVAWTNGRIALAARLYGAAEALCPVAIAPDNHERATQERVCAELRDRLGDDAYAAAHESGRRLSIDEALSEAVRLD